MAYEPTEEEPNVEIPRQLMDIIPGSGGGVATPRTGTLPGIAMGSLFDFSTGDLGPSLGSSPAVSRRQTLSDVVIPARQVEPANPMNPVTGGGEPVFSSGADVPVYDPDIGPNEPPMQIGPDGLPDTSGGSYDPPPVTWTSDEIVPPDLYNVLGQFSETIDGLSYDPDNLPSFEQDENGNWVQVEDDYYGSDQFTSDWQGQANESIDILKSTSTSNIEDDLMDWLEEQVLGGGGIGVSVSGEPNSLWDLLLGIPLIGGGITKIRLVDEDGNIVIGDSIEKLWKQVKSIPGQIVEAANNSIQTIIDAGESVGGVDEKGNILGSAGEILGTIFQGPWENLAEDASGIPGSVVNQVIDTVNADLEVSTPFQPETSQPAPVPDETGGRQDRTVQPETMPDQPIPDETGGRRDDVVSDGASVDLSDGDALSDGGNGGDLSDGGASGGGGDDLSEGGGGGSGGASGIGRSMFNPYMGGLGYDLARPQSVLYNPTDPMQQLNQIIGRSLFGDML